MQTGQINLSPFLYQNLDNLFILQPESFGMNLTYKQKFLQQKDLQQTLYSKFGYKIESMNQFVEKKKKTDQYPITANIKLRRVTPSLYRNQKIEQVQKQIQDIKRDRKRRQEQSKLSKNGQDPNKYINKMKHIINHYNYLIDHKHIKQKGTDEARRMLNIQPKTQAQKAVEQISELKEQLMRANIKDQFKLNKRINDLYRLFKDKIDEPLEPLSPKKRAISQRVKTNDGISNFRVMSRAMQESHKMSSIGCRPKGKGKQKNRLDLKLGYSLQQVNSNSQRSQKYLNISLNEGHMRKVNSHVQNGQSNKKPLIRIDQTTFSNELHLQKSEQQEKLNNKKKQELQNQIIQPYISRKFIQEGRKMDVKIKNNSDALELWKGRIAEAIPAVNQLEVKYKQTKNQQPYNYINSEDENQKLFRQINDSQLGLKEHVPYVRSKKNSQHQTVQSLKMKNKQQQEILSQLLQKRHCKYVRPWGTKILVKYNASTQAKQMLGLSPAKVNNKQGMQTQSQTNFHGPKLHLRLQQKLKLPVDHSLKQNLEEVQLDWNKQIDQEYYWTMCKNQKINLLLKGKRR